MIMSAMKGLFHLNIHTPDPTLYGRMKDGGVINTSLNTSIPGILKKKLL